MQKYIFMPKHTLGRGTAMKRKYALALTTIIAIFIAIVMILWVRSQSILAVMNFLFIVGIATIIAGAFIACKIPNFAIRRSGLQAAYPNNPPFNVKRSIKVGLLIIAIGIAIMSTSIFVWEIFSNRII